MSASHTEQLLDFIRRSPTALHCAENVAARLRQAGYTELWEQDAWTLTPGGRYFVRRNGSAIAAFALPEKTENTHFQIFAAHGDSPALRVKTVSTLADGNYQRLNTEPYGGGLWGTWFDRPLSVAGRVTLRQPDGSLAVKPVVLDRDLLMLPNLPIHFNRAANDGVKIDNQADLCPLLGNAAARPLTALLAEALGAAERDILSHELIVYCRSEGRVWGDENEYISSPRLDDQECVYAGLQGLLASDGGRSIRMLVSFDNEEIGSATRQGAAGTLLPDLLQRIAESLGWSAADLLRAVSASYLLSADNAHALHPAHGELYDAGNRTVMNGGVVLKHAVAYATDGVSDGILRLLCADAGLPLQDFANRSNVRGGSTLANIASGQLNLRMADIGLPQLAMHSAYETAGTKDLGDLVRLSQAFFARTLTETQPGTFCWTD